ncbi:hypothetical protein MIND_01142600 [Mycena indigotica]|uniref:Uncharacterized protein n=1 Tax=Mycena indigotica TaxID=2126181 RepID=A0A8H6S752_9AGAR|nr:uncharacterized protein MIND_01142600 [Mycena indigotica]KAF7293632.1 hypothetical protein MIND_01142600 [Mycena indigotica]
MDQHYEELHHIMSSSVQCTIDPAGVSRMKSTSTKTARNPASALPKTLGANTQYGVVRSSTDYALQSESVIILSLPPPRSCSSFRTIFRLITVRRARRNRNALSHNSSNQKAISIEAENDTILRASWRRYRGILM